METCVRGFSYMVDKKSESQYIEDDELERTWRSTRRERMKKREQSIWDNFVKEKDAVKGVCSDDPYQFIEPLPESCMTEIMEDEQPKLSREIDEEEARAKREHDKEQAQHSTGVNSAGEDEQHTCVVTFADDMDNDDSDMFHIFDDEQSGGEDEPLNESNDPETVREMSPESGLATVSAADLSQEKNIALQKSSSNSSENVARVIESSIYCARVKELRTKINEELLDLITSLDRHDILLTSEPEDMARMVKRSAEFCNRFNRIYMYQLQRQIHDIKRNNSQTLPFAKHTQFQSQMSRIVSLHQNLLQSFMVFHKSFTQTCCVRESVGALGSLLAAVRDSTHMCLSVTPPKDFTACLDLYKDDLLSTCDKVDDFVSEYAMRCEEFLNRFETKTARPKKTKKEPKTKRTPWNNRVSIKSGTESQLSMYSMDTLHLNTPKSNSSHNASKLGTSSKARLGTGSRINTNTNGKKGAVYKKAEAAKTPSPRKSRRPLMRDPHAGRPRAPKRTGENDVRTMVEAMGTVNQSSYEGEQTPKSTEACKNSQSPIRHDQETEEQDVFPVLTVKCAMKQELKEDESSGKEKEPDVVESPKDKKKKPDRLKVTRLLKHLYSGDGSGTELVSGNKNVQLVHINGNSPRQASTPQLLRILEETIIKKVPKPMFSKPATLCAPDRCRLQFNINEQAADALFQYRTKFVQHMLTSAMYANCAVGKPWEMIGNVSDTILNDVLLSCVSKMELQETIQELYKKETC